MRTPGSWLALALVLAMVGAGPVAAQSPAEPPDEEAAEPVAAEVEDDETLPPIADEEPGGPPSDEDFIPSERIPADASIAFPVDI
jgi:hypothetical protein